MNQMTHPIAGVSMLAICAVLCGCERSAILVSQLHSEREALEILVRLDEADIPADVASEKRGQEQTWRVSVPANGLKAARATLHAYGLPREQRPGLEKVLERKGLFESPAAERERRQFALANEVAATLELYDRVLRARVHFVVPDAPPLSDAPAEEPTASVVIRYLDRDDASSAAASSPEPVASSSELPVEVNQVRELVAQSLGVQSDHVVVQYARVAKPAPPRTPRRVNSAATTAALSRREWLFAATAAVETLLLTGLLFHLHRSSNGKTAEIAEAPA
jgi:type III secretion system YscJ/HrcJ family lipoprotein